MPVAAGRPQMGMAVAVLLDHGHQVQLAVADTGLGDHRVGEGLHGMHRTAQDHHLHAVVVVQVGVG